MGGALSLGDYRAEDTDQFLMFSPNCVVGIHFDAHLIVCEQASNADDDDVVITKTLLSPTVGDDCCICLSPLIYTNFVTTACGHHIHRRCFDRLPAESRRTQEELMQARAFHFNPRVVTKVVRCPMCRTYLIVKHLTFGYEVVTSVLA